MEAEPGVAVQRLAPMVEIAEETHLGCIGRRVSLFVFAFLVQNVFYGNGLCGAKASKQINMLVDLAHAVLHDVGHSLFLQW